MLSKNDLAKLYETVLSIPGMGDPVKIDLRLSRKNVLLLSKVIQRGLSTDEIGDKGAGMLEMVLPSSSGDLAAFATELLQKAGLQEMSERLEAFNGSDGKGAQ